MSCEVALLPFQANDDIGTWTIDFDPVYLYPSIYSPDRLGWFKHKRLYYRETIHCISREILVEYPAALS